MTKSLHRHYKSHGKERRKRCVFRRLQKTGRDGADVTWRGRSFQVRVATTGKGRSPTVDSRVRRTDSDDVDASYCSRHNMMHGHPHFRTTSQSLCGTLSHMLWLAKDRQDATSLHGMARLTKPPTPHETMSSVWKILT